MRNIRMRRRFDFILIVLLVICLLLFLEGRIEAFVPQLKNFAETKVAEAFGGNFKISIGSIDGGIIRPFIFSDIKINDVKNSQIFASFVIRTIKTNYRIWDLLFRPKGNSEIFIIFNTLNKEIEGFADIRGTVKNSEVTGLLNLFDKAEINFSGNIKDGHFDIELRPDKSGSIKAEGIISDDGALNIIVKVNHIRLHDLDIVCDANLQNRIAVRPDASGTTCLEGRVETKNLILNYKPFLDLTASYRICDGILEVSDLNMGDKIINVRGKVLLRQPYNIDTTLVANNLNLGWFLSSLGVRDTTAILSGTMNLKADLKGPARNIKSNIKMELKKGTIATLGFESLSASLKGDGPFIRIEDSRVTRESGYFVLAGEMDLRKIGKTSMFDDIRLVTDDKAIMWDGWDASKNLDIQEVRMKKKINDYINLDFKKIFSEEKIDESLRDNDEVHLEYKLDANDSLRMKIGQDNKDFFGLEHKDKF